MSYTLDTLTPRQAWSPLPRGVWTEAHARHLLRRIGFSATPASVQDATQRGAQGTVDYYFGKVRPFVVPTRIQMMITETPKLESQARKANDQKMKQDYRDQIRRLSNSAYQDFAISWLEFARKQENSPQEKYVLFLQDILVVGRDKVKSTALLYQHQNMLRREGFGKYPDIVKAVSRSPAMIEYLDLKRSSKNAPNENFAREVFELFTLGEGNYSEKDIKEAAKAFTGYRYEKGKFRMDSRAYDDGPKTVFGKTGPWNGDQVIDIVYEQPAAATFVPKEFIRYYVSETPLPDAYVEYLGTLWASKGYDMHFLIETVFTSQLFYQPQFQGNIIKSPIHYYIGLCQDLNLDTAPFASSVLSSLRGMGQTFQTPPNVRGWVGGKHWINTTTLAARRQAAKNMFHPINEKRLNADDFIELQAARAEGKDAFFVTKERLGGLEEKTPEFITNHFCEYFLPEEPPKSFKTALLKYLESKQGKNYVEGIKDITVAILQSPQYQMS